jgi:hypothetical protein
MLDRLFVEPEAWNGRSLHAEVFTTDAEYALSVAR